jgi:lipid-A-disaccharide synthase
MSAPGADGVYIVAVEASGDALGADLVESLRAKQPGLSIGGVGLEGLKRVGVSRPIDLSGLSILGFVDGIKALSRVKVAVEAVSADIIATNPKVAVLIDSWGFTVRVAAQVRARAPHIRLVKYVGPQVWATRPGRAKTLAALVDHLICIHDFEPAYYAPYGLDCTVCGHPAIGRHVAGDAAAFRLRHGLNPAEPILVIAPGSRPSEMRRVAPTLWRSAQNLIEIRPTLRLVCVPAQTVREEVSSQIREAGLSVLTVDEAEKGDAFAAATAVLAASGTVTTEIALQRVPVVIAYKLGWVTWALARTLLFKSPYAALINVAANAEVAPEFIQTKMTVPNLVAATGLLLDDEAARAAQIAAQDEALKRMGQGGPLAQEIAADVVLDQMTSASSKRSKPGPMA